MNLPLPPEPRFFDTKAGPRFGCFQPASPGVPAGMPVLVVGSVGHESIQFHRLLRQLSLLLAAQGMPSLRFDPRGIGDSPGDESDWSLEAWVEDVQAARAELLRRTGQTECLGIGMRLGGSLLLCAGAEGPAFSGVALFDPVSDGALHLEELDRAHQAMLRYAHVCEEPGPQDPEVLGFRQTPGFRQELARWQVGQCAARPAAHALVVQSHPEQDPTGLVRHLEGLGVGVELRREEEANLWEWVEDFGRVHVPRGILEILRDWCREQAP